jgi:CrcB protein
MGLKEIIIIFIGGGLGSLSRFVLGRWIINNAEHPFPFGTFIVNIMACLILGFVIGLADHKGELGPLPRLFWTIGFCGGFSTFSTFSNETLRLFQEGQFMTMLLYISFSVVLCVTAVFGGQLLAQKI